MDLIVTISFKYLIFIQILLFNKLIIDKILRFHSEERGMKHSRNNLKTMRKRMTMMKTAIITVIMVTKRTTMMMMEIQGLVVVLAVIVTYLTTMMIVEALMTITIM